MIHVKEAFADCERYKLKGIYKMSLHRYFGIKKFTQAAIDAHASGKPFHPAGCRGNISMYYCNDEQTGEFKGVDMSFGTCIRCTSTPEYIYTLNLLLDKGANIIVDSATSLGIITQCSYTLEDSIATTTEPFVPPSPELEASDEPANTKPQVEDHPIRGITPEKAFVDEIAESPESTADLSEPTKSENRNLPDWDYAQSLSEGVSKSDAKKKLESYAHEFGVNLNRQQKFENMMQNFMVEMEA